MIKVCAVQAEPEWFDLQGSVKKAIGIIEEAGHNGAELIAFPEVFIPGYPMFLWKSPLNISENVNYINNSLNIDSEEFKSICNAAKKNSIAVVIGFSENDKGSVYISQAIINKFGELLLVRRKFKCTHVERVLFGDARASNIKSVVPLQFAGKKYNVGANSCWEHAQPLLTYYGATQNEEIHVAAWPPLAEYKESADYLYSLSREGAQALCATYAIESSCYVISSTAVVSQKLIDRIGDLPDIVHLGCGATKIFAPDGREYVKPLSETEEGLVYAEIDDNELNVCRHFLHITGHYSRPDLFSLKVQNSDDAE